MWLFAGLGEGEGLEGVVTGGNRLGRRVVRVIGDVRREVNKLYQELGNWRAVGAALGISGGMAYRIGVQGYEPREARIRSRLGLAAMGEAPVCAACGVVHVSRRCPAGRGRRWRDLWEADVDALREALERRQEWK